MLTWRKFAASRLTKLGAVAALSMLALALPAGYSLPKLMIWNASASVPKGLYLIGSAARLRPGDIIAMRLPAFAETLADRRNYLPAGIPLLKPVAAMNGQVVCRRDQVITIDSIPVAMATRSDRAYRPLPVWAGCVRLNDNQIFVLNPSVEGSFDGRYFGVTDQNLIAGRAHAIFTEDTVSHHYRIR